MKSSRTRNLHLRTRRVESKKALTAVKRVPVGEAKKNKRKAVVMNETNRRMEEAYEIMKQIHNTEPPKTTLCTAYGQLLAERLETICEMNRIIVMNEIDNLFFRAKMGSLRSQYQSAFSGQASPASLYSSSSDETCNDIFLPTQTYTTL